MPFIRNPDDGAVGPAIRELTKHRTDPDWSNEVQLLCFVANHMLLERKIRRLQEKHPLVVMDRNWLSTLVYQHDAEGCEEITERYCDLIPDKLVYIKVPVAVTFERWTSQRRSLDGFEAGGHGFLQKLQDRYDELIPMYIPEDRILRFDGQKPPEELHEEIYSKLNLGD